MSPERRSPLDPDGTVVVVGGGLAGLRAAEGLRRGGFRGRLVMVGAESHPPYDRPPLSKQVLVGAWEPTRATLRDEAGLSALEVEARLGRAAVSLDAASRRIELDDGTVIDADGVVIATGATARRPFTEAGVLALRTLEDCAAIREALVRVAPGGHLVVIGAGFIGSEVAAAAVGLGLGVTVVEALSVPLAPALGEVIGAALGRLHERHGVEVRTGAGVRGVRVDGSSMLLDLADRSTVAADVVVAGIGVTPETSWLEGSGLTLSDGVVCDEGLFAAEGVVGAGDVARFPFRGESVRIEHWQMAADMGAAAAVALLAGRAATPSFEPVPYFWSDQYGEKIQMLGRPGPGDEVVLVDGDLDGRFVALYTDGRRLNAVVAVSRPRQLMAYRSLLQRQASVDEALQVAASSS